jgi:hypothetical protein
LRSRVLHFVQFMTTPRMDDLGKSRLYRCLRLWLILSLQSISCLM